MGSQKVNPVTAVAPKTRTIVPTANHLLLKKMEQSNKSGDIFIPETIERPAVRMDYLVMGVGPKVSEIYPSIKLGSKVVITKNHGQDIELDGFAYLLIKAEDIIGVWNRGK